MMHNKNWGEFEQHNAYDGRQEFAQWIKDKNDIHSDRLDSSIHVFDSTGHSAMRLGYSALGRTYRKYDDVMSYYYDLEPLANYEFAQLMPVS